MRILISLISFLLSLAGCDQQGSNSVTTTLIDGVEVLHSSIAAPAEGVATFECVRSISGHCNYVIFTSNCAEPGNGSGTIVNTCTTRLIDQFSLAVNATRELIGLPAGFRHCVSRDKPPVAPYCNS